MSTPGRAWRLNHGLRDAQNVCALPKVGTILKRVVREVYEVLAGFIFLLKRLWSRYLWYTAVPDKHGWIKLDQREVDY